MMHTPRSGANKYGDSDFVQEDWPQQTTPLQPNVPPQSNPQYQAPDIRHNALRPPGPTRLEMTREDFLFFKTWRRDCIFTRVLPVAATISALQYYRDRARNVPLSVMKYSAIFIISFPIGFLSYVGELKQRILASQSTTPVMQYLRSNLQSNGAFSGPISPMGVEPSGFVNEPEPYRGTQPTSFVSEQTSFVNDQGSVVGEQSNPKARPGELGDWKDVNYPTSSDSTSGATYEELRAKNRGYIK